MKIKKNKLVYLLFGTTVAISGCVGNSSNSNSSSVASTSANVITLANNPYLESGALQTLSSSGSDITPPNSVVTDQPKIKKSDEEAYLGIPILNNTGATITGFYIHNWDRTAGNYINGNGMSWESGIEIAHTMQNNKYHDWYFPIGITEANVNDFNVPWNAYGYLGGHTSSSNSWNPSTQWTIELKLGNKCYYTHTSRSEAHDDENLVDTINGWYGGVTNVWAYGLHPLGSGWGQIGSALEDIGKTLAAKYLLPHPADVLHNGLWSEFTPDEKDGYNWNIHAGTGFAQQDVNGNWSAILSAIPDSLGNASFDLALDPNQSDCNDINSSLPSNHPAGNAMPVGNWSVGCSAASWDGTTLTALCGGHTSSLDTKICADPTNVTTDQNGSSLACGWVVGQGAKQVYNNNINTLIRTNLVTTNPFTLPSNNVGACEILAVNDNMPESAIPTADGISSITAECYSQSMALTIGTHQVGIVSTIDPQSCKTSSGAYNIVSLNGNLVCGGGSSSQVSVTNTVGASMAYIDGTVTAAVPVTNNTLLSKIMSNMANWIETELNAVNNISFVNYNQVCTTAGVTFNQKTQVLQCNTYQSDISNLVTNDNTQLFNGNNAVCSIVGASRDESGNIQNIEYNCGYGNNPYSTTGLNQHTGFINPSLCYNGVMNESTTTGELSCAASNPAANIPGSWLQTCKNPSENGGSLTATCSTDTYSTPIVTSTLNYNDVCASNSTVSNKNGYLSCDTYNNWWNVIGSSNSWLAVNNSSCIVEDVTLGEMGYQISGTCLNNSGTYNKTSINTMKCMNSQGVITLSNSNGNLVCGS